jgi:hypothetical protein
VRFRDGATTLALVSLVDGVGTYTTTALLPGLRTITATYSGGGAVEPSVSLPLVLAISGGSVVSAAASPPTARYGEPVVLTAAVTPVAPETSTPAGMLAFRDGVTALAQVPLTGGAATYTAGALSVGTHSISAVYQGQAPYAPSVSPAITVRVEKGATRTTLVAQFAGGSAVLTATVVPVAPAQGTPTGTVKFRRGSTTLATVAVVGGVAVHTTGLLAPGVHAFTALYGGDARFQSGASTVTSHVVGGSSTIALSSSANPSVATQPVTFTAVVQGLGAPPAPTGTVTFRTGTKVLGIGPLVGGVARLTTAALAVKSSHAITAVYGGDTSYPAATSSPLSQDVRKGTATTTVVSADDDIPPGQDAVFTATVRAEPPAVVTPAGTVRFLANGSSIGTASLGGGRATLKKSLPLGQYQIRAVYIGSAAFESSQSPTITQQISPD